MGQLDGCGGMRKRGGVTLAYGPDRPDGPNGQDGCVSLYPVGLLAAVWYGSGEELPLDNAQSFDTRS